MVLPRLHWELKFVLLKTCFQCASFDRIYHGLTGFTRVLLTMVLLPWVSDGFAEEIVKPWYISPKPRICHCPILTRDRGKVRGLTLGSHGAAQTPSLDLGGLHIGGRGNPDARNKGAGKTLGKKKQSLWATQTNSQTNSNQTNS